MNLEKKDINDKVRENVEQKIYFNYIMQKKKSRKPIIYGKRRYFLVFRNKDNKKLTKKNIHIRN